MNCPNCQGILQSLPMVYKSGISTGSSVGISSGLKVGVARHSSISALAEEAAPPKQPMRPLYYFAWCMLPFLMAGLAPKAALVLMIIIGAVSFWRYRQKKAEYLTALYEWQNSYLCLSCGRTFLDD